MAVVANSVLLNINAVRAVNGLPPLGTPVAAAPKPTCYNANAQITWKNGAVASSPLGPGASVASLQAYFADYAAKNRLTLCAPVAPVIDVTPTFVADGGPAASASAATAVQSSVDSVAASLGMSTGTLLLIAGGVVLLILVMKRKRQ